MMLVDGDILDNCSQRTRLDNGDGVAQGLLDVVGVLATVVACAY